MSMHDYQFGVAGPFRPHQELVMQMHFDPGDELRERLSELYLPSARDIGRRGLFLSSQYRMVTERLPGNRLAGNDGQKVAHIGNALKHSSGQNRLAQYMRLASAMRNGREYVALQFAVHLHPRTIDTLRSDELLQGEPILPPNENAVKAIVVYEANSILDGDHRQATLRKIGQFVSGLDILPHDGGNPQRRSLNQGAFVTNARFTASTPHDRRSGR